MLRPTTQVALNKNSVGFGRQLKQTEFDKSRTDVQDRVELERLSHHDQYEEMKCNFQLADKQLVEHRDSLDAMEEENSRLRQEIQAKSSQVKQYAKEVDRLKKQVRSYRTCKE